MSRFFGFVLILTAHSPHGRQAYSFGKIRQAPVSASSCGNPFEGIGKPEPLKGNLFGFWSRFIDEYNRLVYRIQGEQREICQVGQCKGHCDE